jgi:hypothetical protein
MDVRYDQGDELVGDLGHVVVRTGVFGDLFEDPFLGIGSERRGATGDYSAAREGFHLADLLSGSTSSIAA